MMEIRIADKKRVLVNTSICGKSGSGKTSLAVEMANELVNAYGDAIRLTIISDEDEMLWLQFTRLHSNARMCKSYSSFQTLYEDMLQQFADLRVCGSLAEYNKTCDSGAERKQQVVIVDCTCEDFSNPEVIRRLQYWNEVASIAEFYLVLVTNHYAAWSIFPRRCHTHKAPNGDLFAMPYGVLMGNSAIHKFSSAKKQFYESRK